jgi:hypothetical protein
VSATITEAVFDDALAAAQQLPAEKVPQFLVLIAPACALHDVQIVASLARAFDLPEVPQAGDVAFRWCSAILDSDPVIEHILTEWLRNECGIPDGVVEVARSVAEFAFSFSGFTPQSTNQERISKNEC